MRTIVIILGILFLFAGCVTAEKAAVTEPLAPVVQEATPVEPMGGTAIVNLIKRKVVDGKLTKDLTPVEFVLPDDVPRFHEYGEAVWMYEEDLLRVAMFPLHRDGEVSMYSGGWGIALWVDRDDMRVIAMSRVPMPMTGEAQLYWIYQDGKPVSCSKADYDALLKWFAKKEGDRENATES